MWIIAAPVVSSAKLAAARARHDPQLEGRARGPGADQRRLVVDRDEALLAAHLLDEHVAEQAAAAGAFAVGAGPLALAGHGRRDELERVELGVGVLERGPGAAALVDDQLHVGGVGVGAHPLAPGLHRRAELLLAQLGHRGDVLRCVDDHLVGAGRRARGEEVGLAGPPRLQQRVAGAGEGARLALVASDAHRDWRLFPEP